MKVLHMEMGRHLYGGARQVAYLLEGLAKFPGEHGLVCAEGSAIAGAIVNPSVSIHALKSSGDLDFEFIGGLRRVIQAEKPDLLHIHSRRGDMLAALAGRLENLPMVHSRRVDNKPGKFDLRFKFPLFRKIVAISEGIRQVLLQAGVPEEQAICIPSAVDTERFRPSNARERFLRAFKLGGEGPVLAMIAQLIPRKGHEVFFQSLPAVIERHPQTRALIFGRGPLQEELRRYVSEHGLESHVSFEGFRADMKDVIPHLDLVVHPAYKEGLGVCLLETAACGVPIVACRAGGIPEIVRDGINGYLVEPGDSQGLASAINALLCDPARLTTFGKAGRALVLERFSIERMVEDNRRLYLELLGYS